MKRLKVLGLSILVFCGCQSVTVSAQRRMASVNLVDTPYTFDPQKVLSAKNSFHFVRSFVDYFYRLIAQNRDELSFVRNFSRFTGKCVGDAHAENFGFLLQRDGTSKFTMNDIDDFGPCPVALDLYRFMMSSSLFDPTLDQNAIFVSYLKGLRGESVAMPNTVETLRATSLSRGPALNPKKVVNLKFARDASNTDVDASTASFLTRSILTLHPAAQVLDLVKTEKVGGGSGGLTRYQVLIKESSHVWHLEAKEQIRPAIYPVATSVLPDIRTKISEAIQVEQGPQTFSLYDYLNIQGKEMFVRPILWGNVGVSLGSNSAENFENMEFEAYTLGQIHRLTVTNVDHYVKTLETTDFESLKNDVTAMAQFMDQKYKGLHP